MRALGRNGKIGINRTGKRMNEIRPLGAEQPERAAALAAKMALGGAHARILPAVSIDDRVIHRYMLAALELECSGISGQVDRIAATSLCLAADRAIAALIGIRIDAGQRERHSTTMTGTFELHVAPPVASVKTATEPRQANRQQVGCPGYWHGPG